VISARLGDASRYGTNADFGHQLDRYIARRVDVLEVEDELRKVFDRIDVVMRRR